MGKMVEAKTSFAGVNGILVRKGELLAEDHPAVKLYPSMFQSSEVERATAAPGERRNVRRPRKATP